VQTNTPARPAPKRAAKAHSAASPAVLAIGRRLAIGVGLADVHGEPNATSELVTQTRLGTPARCLAVEDGWALVRLPDYVGWVRAGQLASPARMAGMVAVVVAHWAPVFAASTGGATLETACVASVLPVAAPLPGAADERVAVRLPGRRLGWVERASVALRPAGEPFPPGGPEAALALSRALLGVPYLWGGTSPRGVDCSGLVQLCYQVAGCQLPRNADQQHDAVTYVVERGDLQPGDLLFFAARGGITHVAFSLGGERLLHASGSAKRVTMNSLDPAASDYAAHLSRMYAAARRPMPGARPVMQAGVDGAHG
jgi:cell wall-associated NlpC family hydrolase